MTALEMKQHDLLPAVTITLTDGATPVDLTGAASIKVIAARYGVPAFTRAVTGSDVGVIVMPWQVGDTAVAGSIDLEVEVTWPGAKPQTFPARGYLRVEILPDLG